MVGGDVPASVLGRLTGLTSAMLEKTLGSLDAAKFLFNSRPPPEGEYSFYHALTQEVAYRSLLKGGSGAHAAACDVFAELHAGRTEKVAELLAYHAELGGLWEQAALYLRQCGISAIERSAYREAIGFLERALEALGRSRRPSRARRCRSSCASACASRLADRRLPPAQRASFRGRAGCGPHQ